MNQSIVQSALSGPQYDAWLGYHSELPRANGIARKNGSSVEQADTGGREAWSNHNSADRTYTGTGEAVWRETDSQSAV